MPASPSQCEIALERTLGGGSLISYTASGQAAPAKTTDKHSTCTVFIARFGSAAHGDRRHTRQQQAALALKMVGADGH